MNQEIINGYVQDNESPYHNMNMGLEYERIGQSTSAISFYLRCAERMHNIDQKISYECLIHMGKCFDDQGRRGKTAQSCWRKDLTMLPKRPEAYYYLARTANWLGNYDEAYTLTTQAMLICEFDDPLQNTSYIDPTSYKSCLLFDKGYACWFWGKFDEGKEIFLDLYKNHYSDLPEYQRDTLFDYLKNKYEVEGL